MTTLSLNGFNKFVKNFFDNNEEPTYELWMNDDTQKLLKNMMKAKKVKDESAPKKSTNAFIFFCQKHRDSVKTENPGLKSSEITSKLGELWRVLKDKNETDEYQKLADSDKKRYEDEKKNYEPSEKSGKSKKKSKSSVKGKRSAYILFCSDTRASVKKDFPSLSSKEVLSALAKKWNSLKDENPAELERFKLMAVKDAERYTEEMKKSVKVEDEVVEDDTPIEEEKVETKKPKKTTAKKDKPTKKKVSKKKADPEVEVDSE